MTMAHKKPMELNSLMHNAQVTMLDYANRGLGPPEILMVSSALCTTPAVVEVNISKNAMGINGACAFATVLAETKIQKLIIGPKSTVIPMHDTENLITKLNVANQNLGPAEIMLISAAIPTNPGLVGVDISRNQISADVAPTLIESIQKSNIKTLVIGKSASLAVDGLDATSLDYSGQDLGPGEIMPISALVIPTTAGPGW